MAGQETFLDRLATVVEDVSGGLGIYYWEPVWVTEPWLGSSCTDNLLASGETEEVQVSLSTFGKL